METPLVKYNRILKLKDYSENTCRVYTHLFQRFLDDFRGYNIDFITPDEIKKYLIHIIETREISSSFQNQYINAIKFYYEKVLYKPKVIYAIERPKREKKLPTVLSVEEVKRLLGSVTNLKHLTEQRYTLCGTVLQRIYWKMGQTSGTFRNC